ncbi:MAG: hypothetical protein RL392_1319 [Pseudomonadota bacterium]|jgi:hypothetical protein
MARIFASTLGFLASYLVLMVPTYLLPYTGSNSSIVNGASAIMGRGPTPMWWMHFWCLFMLILIGHVRGRLVGKGYLLAFPIVALVFDLTPGLSSIPLVPTVMHLLCMILGAMGSVPEAADGVESPSFGGSGRAAMVVSIIAVMGMLWFALATPHRAKTESPASAPALAPAPEPASTPPAAQAKVKASEDSQAVAPPKPKPAPPTPKPGKTAPEQTAKPAKADKPTVQMINIHEP